MTTLWNNYFSTGINYNQRNTHMRLSNLGQRFITALLGAAVIIGCTLISPYSFSACFYLLAMLTQYEYLRILTPLKGETPQQQLHIAGNLTLGTIVYFLIALIAYGVIDTSYYSLFFVLFAGIVILELYKNRPNPFQYIGLRIIGLVYVVIPFALLNTISISADNFYPLITLGILCIIWANDVFAYFAGRAFGKHKLFERISPKKTWEGFAGGFVAALACAAVLSHYSTALTLPQWVITGALVSIAGTFGDLAESMFKRSLHIKDSSQILPGHGGFLDRFDALLIAVPFVYAWLSLI